MLYLERCCEGKSLLFSSSWLFTAGGYGRCSSWLALWWFWVCPCCRQLWGCWARDSFCLTFNLPPSPNKCSGLQCGLPKLLRTCYPGWEYYPHCCMCFAVGLCSNWIKTNTSVPHCNPTASRTSEVHIPCNYCHSHPNGMCDLISGISCILECFPGLDELFMLMMLSCRWIW